MGVTFMANELQKRHWNIGGKTDMKDKINTKQGPNLDPWIEQALRWENLKVRFRRTTLFISGIPGGELKLRYNKLRMIPTNA